MSEKEYEELEKKLEELEEEVQYEESKLKEGKNLVLLIAILLIQQVYMMILCILV